jgi:predicted DNA binding CopG/RHH family protein
MRSGKVRGAVPLKTVTIRLPVPDLETVRDLAEREGLSYQHWCE